MEGASVDPMTGTGDVSTALVSTPPLETLSPCCRMELLLTVSLHSDELISLWPTTHTPPASFCVFTVLHVFHVWVTLRIGLSRLNMNLQAPGEELKNITQLHSLAWHVARKSTTGSLMKRQPLVHYKLSALYLHKVCSLWISAQALAQNPLH